MKPQQSNKSSLFIVILFLHLYLITFYQPLLPKAWAESETFTFSGNSTSISLAEGRRRTILTGNARISSKDLTINADEIQLYGPDFRYARCKGSVQAKSSQQQISLTTAALFLDRDINKMRIRSYTEMVDLKNEIVVKCGYMEHYDEENYSIFQIGVRILKATDEGRMVCRSDYARYDREADTLELSGSPVVYWKGDRYSAVQIHIDLETDEIEMEGNVEGEFTSEGEADSGPGDGTGTGSGPGTEPGLNSSSDSGTESISGTEGSTPDAMSDITTGGGDTSGSQETQDNPQEEQSNGAADNSEE